VEVRVHRKRVVSIPDFSGGPYAGRNLVACQASQVGPPRLCVCRALVRVGGLAGRGGRLLGSAGPRGLRSEVDGDFTRELVELGVRSFAASRYEARKVELWRHRLT
jgi:hypothetical protein